MVDRVVPAETQSEFTDRFPRWSFVSLSVLSVLFTVLPLVEVRLPNAVEVLFALLGLYAFFRFARGVRWSAPVRLMVAAVIVLNLSWGFMLIDHPGLARSGPSLEDFLDKFMFLFIACVLVGSEKKVIGYLAIFGVSIALMPWLSGNGFSEIASGLDGARASFGINPIRTGLLFGGVCIGLLCFWQRIFLKPSFSVWRFVVWSILLCFCATMLLITQSRTAMVAIIPGLLTSVVLGAVLSTFSFRTKAISAAAGCVFLVIVVAGSVFTGLAEVVEQRFNKESVVVERIIEGDFESVPTTSWGLRVHFVVEAGRGILERPLTGWGYRAGEIVLNQDGLRQADGGVFSQVHNSYLEAALRYGVGGALIVLLLFAWATLETVRCWKQGLMSFDVFVFLMSATAYFMVANLFDGLLFQTEGVLMFNVLMGVAASFIFQRRWQASLDGVGDVNARS
ncbi:O-Antigen ligase [Marinobacter litoralis]|uniref:O-Antigen ligase n=1 Tax=Marinobacter litoralis TaxID=187981 RepID=A0A3M2R911_9GAMM|nr:O-antigen ligase family protein [Marinobacter litoralis]RMJ01773.1 O-Antigen ligase [Marinobacter litoralis]